MVDSYKIEGKKRRQRADEIVLASRAPELERERERERNEKQIQARESKKKKNDS